MPRPDRAPLPAVEDDRRVLVGHRCVDAWSRWPSGMKRAPAMWPASHSTCSRTSIRVAPACVPGLRLGRADLADGGLHVGLGAPVVRRVGRRGSIEGDASRERDGRSAPAVRPASDTCSSAGDRRCRSCGRRLRGVGLRLGSGRRCGRGLRRAERTLERLEREQRALHARRADLDAQHLEHVARGDAGGGINGLALDLIGQQRGRGLADRAAAPVNPTPATARRETRSGA